jgi:hypothetical protein
MGVDFAHTMMVGRQHFIPERHTLERVIAVLGLPCDSVVSLGDEKFSEPFFTLLGAKQVSSLDASTLEEATHIHDLNLPLPAALSHGFSAVYDGGTLEHVFDFPQALKSCMAMVSIGGHFMQLTVANNFMGHGFWQLSPELVYRAFTPENGYRIRAVLLHEVVSGGAWYAVRDPKDVHRRVELCNRVPTYLLTIAQRVAPAEIFAKPPQQSDYASKWAGDVQQAPVSKSTGTFPYIPSGLRQLVPQPVKRFARKAFSYPPPGPFFVGPASFSDTTCYRRIEEDDLLRGRI